MHTSLVGLDDDTGNDQRRTAEFEEVVGSTHTVHLQDTSKDIAESPLGIVGRFLIGTADGQLRFGQGFDIRLAIGRHRHFTQLQISRRHHILCQALGYFSLQGIRGYLAIGGIVGTEVFLVIQLTDQDHHLLDAFDLQHHVLDLAQLNTQATELNLMVGTAEDDDVAVRQPLGIVARLVDALAMILHKALTGHLVKIVITSGHTATANIQFTHHTCWQFVAVGINDELLDVQLRFTDGHQFGVCQFGIV